MKLLALLLVGLILSPHASGPGQEPTPSDPTAQSKQRPEPKSEQAARAFQGRIVKAGHKLVFEESLTRAMYQIDDQDKAKQFQGMNVKVIATMDPNTNLLHIVDITQTEK